MNWAMFAMFVTLVLAVFWVRELRRGRWAWPAFVVSLACLIAASLNAAAPVRGAVDPNYMGYIFGLLHADRGLAVTAVAGSVFAAAAASALVAARRRSGPALWLVAATCAGLTAVLGVPTLLQALRDPTANDIQLGEYLTVPGLASTAIILMLLAAPFAFGTVWASRAALKTPRSA